MATSGRHRRDVKGFTKPPEWSDSERMHFLLAPFPADSTPSSDNSKLSFWSSLILESSRELSTPYFTEEGLRNRLRWSNSTAPSCLPVVIDSMEQSGAITKRTDFDKADGWLLWGLKAVAKPMGWALGFTGSRYSGQYVISSQLKELAEKIIDKHKATVTHLSTDNVMKSSEFDHLCSVEVVDKETLGLVKQWLLRAGLIAVKDTELGYSVVRIGSSVSDVDLCIVRLKEAVSNIQRELAVLTERVDQLRQAARANIKQKRKAIKFLRESKVIEETLNKREAVLSNLQAALLEIQSAETNTMVVSAYKSATLALKTMRGETSLEAAEETVSEMRAAIDEGQDLNSLVNQGLDDEDDDELERDLALLLEDSPQGDVEQTNDQAIASLEARLAALSTNEPQEQNPKQKVKKPTALLA